MCKTTRLRSASKSAYRAPMHVLTHNKMVRASRPYPFVAAKELPKVDNASPPAGRTRFRSKVMRKISIWRLYRRNQFRLLKWWRRSEWAGKPGALCVFGCQLVILAPSAPFEGAGGSVGGRVATPRTPKPRLPPPDFLVESIVIRNEARN